MYVTYITSHQVYHNWSCDGVHRKHFCHDHKGQILIFIVRIAWLYSPLCGCEYLYQCYCIQQLLKLYWLRDASKTQCFWRKTLGHSTAFSRPFKLVSWGWITTTCIQSASRFIRNVFKFVNDKKTQLDVINEEGYYVWLPDFNQHPFASTTHQFHKENKTQMIKIVKLSQCFNRFQYQ